MTRLALRFAVLLFVFAFCSPVFAQSVADNASSQVVAEELNASSLVDTIAAFNGEKEELSARIAALSHLESIQADFDGLSVILKESLGEFERRRRLSSWDFRMASDFKASIKPLLDQARKISDDYAAFFKETDALLADLQARQDKLFRFRDKAKTEPALAGQSVLIQETLAQAGQLVSALEKVRSEYAKIYQNRSGELDRVADFKKIVSRQVKVFRGAHLQKSAPSWVDREFYAAFHGGVVDEARVSLHGLLEGFGDWARTNSQQSWHFMVSVAVLFFAFRRLQKSERWRRIFQQPLGLAMTVSLLLLALEIQQPPPFAVLSFWVLLGLLLLIVVRAYPFSREQVRDVSVLVATYALSQAVDTLSLPLPFYRIFLTVLTIAVALYCRRRARDLRTQEGTVWVRNAFRMLFITFALAAAAEAAGYQLLSSYLARGALKSGFLVFAVGSLKFLFLPVVLDVADGALQALHLSLLVRRSVLKKIGFVLNLLLVVITLLSLTTVWGFFDGVAAAWSGVLELELRAGGHGFTVRKAVNAFVWLYCVLAVIETLCALLESAVYTRKHISVGAGKSINTLLTYFAWVLGLFLAFTALGFELQQFAIIAGALSVGIGFGLQNIVNNFVSGLILLFERPIKIGDILDIDGQWGTVEKMGLRSTVIRSASKSQIIIPNSDFVTRKVENLTFTDAEGRIAVKVGVAYGSDPAKVHDILIDVAASHPHVDKEPAPQAFFTEFGDSAMMFELGAWTADVSRKREIVSEFNFEIERRFRAAGIEIPFPRRDVKIHMV